MSHINKLDRKIVVGVLTVSDTRTVETDKGGALVREYLSGADAEIFEAGSVIVKDDVEEIRRAIDKMLGSVDAIITTGGTGISKRDITIEEVSPYFHKEIEGFGEIFRMLSFTEDIGSRSILSRAAAGTTDNNRVIIALPGSSGAVKLAMERLVVPELVHIVSELNK